jgi:hypothetical protein
MCSQPQGRTITKEKRMKCLMTIKWPSFFLTTRQEDYKRKEDEVLDDDQMAILLFTTLRASGASLLYDG